MSTNDDLQRIRDALHSIRLSEEEREQLRRERWELDNYQRAVDRQARDREAQRRRQALYVIR